jgi:hypothetical protein
MSLSLYFHILGYATGAIGLLLIGAGVGGHIERRRLEHAAVDARLEGSLFDQQPDEPEEPGGRHCAGHAPGSSAQRARVKGAITQQFDAITENSYTPDELDRIRSTT